MLNVNKRSLRGDFYFRDVYNRNSYSSFEAGSQSERSIFYVNEENVPIPCTSQVSTYAEGKGALHIYARDGVTGEYDKGNVAQAIVSIHAATTTIRSTNTHASGSFTVGSRLRIADRVGSIETPAAYPLDVTGDVNTTSSYRINGSSVLTDSSLGANVVHSNLQQLGELSQLSVKGNVVAGNVSSNVITGVSMSIDENIVHKGSVLASSISFETTTPFVYNGPGPLYKNGMPFFSQSTDYGTPFLTTDLSKSVFTFTVGGSYMVQAEVQTSYPWFPEGTIYSYYLKNGNPVTKYGCEQHVGSGPFCCTRPYLISVNVNDDICFMVESVVGNEYEVGIRSCRIHMIKLN